MLTLVQPSYGVAAAPLSAADPTVKKLEKQMEARQAAMLPSGGVTAVGASDVSMSAMVEAAMGAEQSYGLVSSMTSQDVAEQYSLTERLLTIQIGSGRVMGSQMDLDV